MAEESFEGKIETIKEMQEVLEVTDEDYRDLNLKCLTEALKVLLFSKGLKVTDREIYLPGSVRVLDGDYLNLKVKTVSGRLFEGVFKVSVRTEALYFDSETFSADLRLDPVTGGFIISSSLSERAREEAQASGGKTALTCTWKNYSYSFEYL